MAGQIPSSLALSKRSLDKTQRRATTLFLKIVRAYHIRQFIFPHLTATEAAKLIRATQIDNLVGPQERSKVLNPMRNLFTDHELGEIDAQLASDPNHHILVVGRDLENLYARVEDADKLDTGIPLLLSIVEATTHRISFSSNSFTTTPQGSELRSEWRAVSTRDLPGEWSTSHAAGSTLTRSCEVSEEKKDIRDRRIRLRRRKLEQITNRHGKRHIVFEHLTHKGIMTLLKGNVKQSLGKTSREPCVLGLDDIGFPMPVLDDLVFVNLRNPVLQKAINSGRTRSGCLSWRQIRQAHIEVELVTFAQHLWYIPMEPGDKKDPIWMKSRTVSSHSN
jgi:hypothetical protein